MGWSISLAMIDALANSHSSPEQVAEFSAQSCLDTESCAQLKSIRTAEKSCFDVKKKASYRRSLSGMTYAHLTAALGMGKWIASLPDSPVSRSASPENNEPKPMIAICGPKRSASFVKWDRDGACWRTYQRSLLSATMVRYSATWPKAGSMFNGACYRQALLEPPTAGSVSGSWLPTPQKSNGNFRDINRKGVLQPSGRWQICGSQSGIKGTASLADYWMLQQKRPLPAGFAEWMMGWPSHWTDLRPLATDKFRSWLQQHGSS